MFEHFDFPKAKDLFEKGLKEEKCQLLLDGFDELSFSGAIPHENADFRDVAFKAMQTFTEPIFQEETGDLHQEPINVLETLKNTNSVQVF